MKRCLCRLRFSAVAAAVAAAVVGSLAGPLARGPAKAGGIIDLGLCDEFTLSQPVVQVQVGTLGPLDLNEYLLDTGASGILAGANSSAELRSKGLVTEATYVDFGVAGPQSTGVSKAYDFAFAGTDGVPRMLPATRMQTSSGNFAFYSGIAGMPLMTGRTVGFDLSSQADMSNLRIGVAFDVPISPTLSAHQYSVPLTMVLFPASGQQHPTDPLPANAALPFTSVGLQYGNTRVDSSFLLDTGAQQSILSRTVAFELGLDVNGNGDLDDEAITFQTVAGVGGSIDIPVHRIDALSLRAANGVDIQFRDITVGIIDIDAAVPGVLGMSVLNSGWEIHALNTFLGIDPGPPGVFRRVDLDFRPASSLQSEMRLTIDPLRDAFMSQGTIGINLAAGLQTQAQAGHVAIGGTGAFTKTGGGTLVLDRANTLTGTTTVRNGTLRIDVANALFGSPTVVEAGATLAFGPGVVARLPSITLAGGILDAGGTLAINGTSGISRVVLVEGDVIGQPALAIGSGGEVKIAGGSNTLLVVSSLQVDRANGGWLDLGMGRITIAAGGITEAEVVAGLTESRGDGSWAGLAGIGSSATAAAVATSEPRYLGWVAEDDGSILIGYAAAGDTNLDGAVDILDAGNMVSGASLGTGYAGRWSSGDFNYDGLVDILDIQEFVSTQLFDEGPYLSALSGLSVAPVPEPEVGGWLAAVGIAVMVARRGWRVA